MASNPYCIWHLTAKEYQRHNGIEVDKGDVLHIWVSDWTKDRIEDHYKNRGRIADYAVAIFPVNKENTADEQFARAKVFCNYMNKLKEAQERAVAGVEMGFLK